MEKELVPGGVVSPEIVTLVSPIRSAKNHLHEEAIEIEIPAEIDKYISLDVSHIPRLCRVCLCEKPNMHSLYETLEVETIAEMLTTFAAVQLSFGDGLPEGVCTECMESISKCFSFKQQCEHSESVLRCFINQGNLQGMKAEESHLNIMHDNLDKLANCVKDTIIENKSDVSNYDVYLSNGFHDDVSPIETDLIEPIPKRDQQQTQQKKLSIITNPVITISPSLKMKDRFSKKKTTKKDKTLNNVITGGSKPSNVINSKVSKNKWFKNEKSIPSDVSAPPSDNESFEGQNENNNKSANNFTCESCGKQFPNLPRLNRHERIHQNEKMFNCTVCKKGFNESRDYRRHLRKHSTLLKKPEAVETNLNYPCPQCHMSFTSEGDLHIHSSIHLVTGDKCVCQHCKKEFETKLQLKRHVRTHLSDKPHKCKVCNKGFSEMGSLTRHFRRHTGEIRERKHVCTSCNKAYFDRHSLKIHLRTHTGERPWECQDCGKKFIDSRLLNSHRKTHSDDKQHACEICEKRFRHESTLTTHRRTHTGEKPYICSVCGNAFVQSSNLSLHMRTHTRERPYACEYCPKSFSSSSSLTSHTRIHTGEKPYACQICFRRFARHDMTPHMRTHTGERPFGCTVCGRHFTSFSQLNQHLRIHTGERPYTCNVCGKGCNTACYLKKHLAKTHNVVSIARLEPNNSNNIKFEIVPLEPRMNCITSVKSKNKTMPSEIDNSSNRVLSISPNTITLGDNNLNVVSVTNGDLGMTENDLDMPNEFTKNEDHNMVSGEVNVGTIVTNTLISDDKLYHLDSGMLRIHHVYSSSQLAVTESSNNSQ